MHNPQTDSLLLIESSRRINARLANSGDTCPQDGEGDRSLLICFEDNWGVLQGLASRDRFKRACPEGLPATALLLSQSGSLLTTESSVLI